METKRIKIEDNQNIKEDQLLEAAYILQQGGLVAFPTETVYGLGANALDEEAAGKIYAAKGRPSDNPLIAHVADMEAVEALTACIPDAGRKLMEAYWPGPLTLVFPKSAVVPYKTTGGLETVAIRMPSDPVAQRLIALAGIPIAAPSANTSGRPSPTTAEHVYQDMNGKIEMIVDGGSVGIGLESTIVDVSGAIPTMLRPGAITIEMLRKTLGQVEIDPAILGPMKEGVKPKAPGMKYRHYAPRAELMLVESMDMDKVVQTILELTEEKLRLGCSVGVICTEETKDRYSKGIVRSLGMRTKETTIAHNLFAVLREYDDLDVDYIFSESFSKAELGQAIMNRLTKAAGYHILKV
ncbi:MAG: L-threonylcarbamoyladenylate synthase [Hungatella sp.]